MANNIINKTDEELLKEKTNFLLFKDYYKNYCEGYSFEEMGKLFYCICYYEWFRKEPEYPDRTTELLFKKIKCDLDSNDNDWVTEVRIRSLQGSKHKGNQYTRKREREEKLEQLSKQALEQNGTTFQNSTKNGTTFQLVPKNGTNGTDTETDTVNKASQACLYGDVSEQHISSEEQEKTKDLRQCPQLHLLNDYDDDEKVTENESYHNEYELSAHINDLPF